MVGPRYLVDANVLSEQTYPRPNPAIIARIEQHQLEVATAAPVWHELSYGFQRMPQSRRRRELERFLVEKVRDTILILPYDLEAADWHAAERARLVAIGRTPPFVDGQIAAIAATNDLILVTANVADFQHFARLRVEDWRVPLR